MIPIKGKLIDQITSLNDAELHESISDMLSQLSVEEEFEFSEEMQAELQSRSQSIASGKSITNEEMIKRFKN